MTPVPSRQPVVIAVALNGARDRREHPDIAFTPEAIAREAATCAEAGAAIVHIHARDRWGSWSASPAWYAEAIRRIRAEVPGLLVSITSMRPAAVPADVVLSLLRTLSGDATTKPDLISINVGHIVIWEPADHAHATRIGQRLLTGRLPRRTVHIPNTYEDIAALLTTCRTHGVTPELGIMDLGFVSNAVALRDDGFLPGRPWFLLELDSPGYGHGAQVAPSTIADYDVLADRVGSHFAGSTWAAHGQGTPGFDVVRRALATGAHIRVGLEDSVTGPNARLAAGNAEMVGWAVREARSLGRPIAHSERARHLIGSGWHTSSGDQS